MSNNRMNRINSEIQKYLAGIISKFDDADIASALISVMKVDTFSDLSMSKIYISVFGDETKKKQIVSKLNDNKKTLRYELAHKIKLRTVPDLLFIVDDVEERAERVLKLFEKIENEKKSEEADDEQ